MGKHVYQMRALGVLAAAGAVIVAARPAPAVTPGQCARQLTAIRTVARQGGVTVGSASTVPVTMSIPGYWRDELAGAGLYRLAADAAAISDPATDRRYVVALTREAGWLLSQCGR